MSTTVVAVAEQRDITIRCFSKLKVRSHSNGRVERDGNALAIDEQARTVVVDIADERRKRLNFQRRAEHNEKIGLLEVGSRELAESLRQTLAEEDNRRLHEPSARCAARNVAGDAGLLDGVDVGSATTVDAVRAGKRAVRLYQRVARYAGGALERVDILREQTQQQALLVQQSQKVVRRRRSMHAGQQLFRERVERFRILTEVVDFEYRLGRRQVVLLQIVVQTSARRAEVRNAGRNANAGAGHHQNAFDGAALDRRRDSLDRNRFVFEDSTFSFATKVNC